MSRCARLDASRACEKGMAVEVSKQGDRSGKGKERAVGRRLSIHLASTKTFSFSSIISLFLSHLRESWRAGIEATCEDVREEEHCIIGSGKRKRRRRKKKKRASDREGKESESPSLFSRFATTLSFCPSLQLSRSWKEALSLSLSLLSVLLCSTCSSQQQLQRQQQ